LGLLHRSIISFSNLLEQNFSSGMSSQQQGTRRGRGRGRGGDGGQQQGGGGRGGRGRGGARVKGPQDHHVDNNKIFTTDFATEPLINNNTTALGVVEAYAKELMMAEEREKESSEGGDAEAAAEEGGFGKVSQGGDIATGGDDMAAVEEAAEFERKGGKPSSMRGAGLDGDDDAEEQFAASLLTEKHDRGLRTGFGSEAISGPDFRVATNYLRIEQKLPHRKIFVYEMTMIDHIHQKPQEPMLLKNRYCMEVVWNKLKNDTSNDQLDDLRQMGAYYVTDYKTIWSLQPLFIALPNGVPDPVGPLDGMKNEVFKDFKIQRVEFEPKRSIDLTLSVAKLFKNQAGTSTEDDDPAVLVRGLNAFVTSHVRKKTEDPTSGIVRKTANNFFDCGKNWELDYYETDPPTNQTPKTEKSDPAYTMRVLAGFFASVRPSINHLLLNVNTASSPFFHKITVQEFHGRTLLNVGKEREERRCGHAPARLPFGDTNTINNILKGTRVLLLRGKPEDDLTNDTSKTRIIKRVGKSLEVQRVTSAANAQTVFEHLRGLTLSNAARQSFNKDTLSVDLSDDPTSRDWYPANWLEIKVPQPARGVLRGRQTDNMIKWCQKRPGVNANAIMNAGLALLGITTAEGEKDLEYHGFKVSNKLITVPGRILRSPTLAYGNTKPTVENASWNLKDTKFISPAPATLFPVWNLTDKDGDDELRMGPGVWSEGKRNADGTLGPPTEQDGFGKFMRQALAEGGLGQSVSTPIQGWQAKWESSGAFETTFVDAMRAFQKGYPGADAFFVVMQDKSQDLYATIKRAGDIYLGAKTVCVGLYPAVLKAGMQTCANIAMKCNLKLNGDNHHLDRDKLGNIPFEALFAPRKGADNTQSQPLSGPNKAGPSEETKTGNAGAGKGKQKEQTQNETIIIGADVAHPLKGASPGCPSIASVVGSVDDEFVKYPGSMRLQMGRQESIDKLWDMVKERLIDWAFQHNNRLPKNILFYRDGVSESQYDGVRKKEIPQLEDAYRLAQLYLNDANSQEYKGKAEDKDDSTAPQPAVALSAPQASSSQDQLDNSVLEDLKDFAVKIKKAKKKGKALQKKEQPEKQVESEKSVDAESKTSAEAESEKTDKEPLPELTTLQALKKLKASKSLFNLTYIVVGKRHNTRFYPTQREHTFYSSAKDERDNLPNGNVIPGLCVDQVITHPYSFDFYLQSHSPIAGTGRAAHYFVLTNQMGLTADQIQSIVSLPCSKNPIYFRPNSPSRPTPSATPTPKRPAVFPTALPLIMRTACVTAGVHTSVTS
jgi:hypothetical protein